MGWRMGSIYFVLSLHHWKIKTGGICAARSFVSYVESFPEAHVGLRAAYSNAECEL